MSPLFVIFATLLSHTPNLPNAKLVVDEQPIRVAYVADHCEIHLQNEVQNLPDDVIAVIIGHELGHCIRHTSEPTSGLEIADQVWDIEYDADKIGTIIATNAGYDASQFNQFIQPFPVDPHHPSGKQRVRALQTNIREYPILIHDGGHESTAMTIENGHVMLR